MERKWVFPNSGAHHEGKSLIAVSVDLGPLSQEACLHDDSLRCLARQFALML